MRMRRWRIDWICVRIASYEGMHMEDSLGCLNIGKTIHNFLGILVLGVLALVTVLLFHYRTSFEKFFLSV
jgi:hypothetical protein